MSVINNNLLLTAPAASSTTGVSRSLRFNAPDSAYLSRTPSVAGNRKTWTWAGWVKRSALGSRQNVFGTADASFYNGLWLEFFSNDTIRLGDIGASALDLELITSQVFRDPSSWGHLVIAVDTTQSTASNRIKLYWNGIQITAFSTSTYPTQNFDTRLNTASAHGIGRAGSYNAQYFDGYLANIHFIDGQALDPSSFTTTDLTTGQLIPKAYTGSYGTNGFKLNFSDNSTTAALGTDTSGNGNTWTVNNFSVTAGVNNDSLVDTPTSYGTDTGAGGEVRGNYCVLNALTNGGTLANGNLDFSTGASHALAKSTFAIPVSGFWYAEATVTTLTSGSVAAGFGLGTAALSLTAVASSAAGAWEIYASDLRYFNRNGTQTSISGTFAAGAILQLAVDPANNRAWVGVNNTWYDGSNGTTGNPSTGSNPTFTSLPADLFVIANTYSNTLSLNFGQRPFAYTAPSGFKALCTTNLPAPVVAKPNTVMNAILDTGANILSAAQAALSGGADLLWIKDRANANNHQLIDTVRGGTATMQSNTTAAETTYSAPSGSSVAWVWDAGTSTVTNTAGSITSSVRANATAGFSVVTYTGNGVNGATVGHGLGVAPSLLICKVRNASDNWCVYHASIGASLRLNLNTTAGTTSGTAAWGTAPTSSVFSIGTSGEVNTNGNTFVCYAWAPVSGYSNAFSYTGNGDSSGPFVYLGFRPRFIIQKRTDSAGSWLMIDTARDPVNVARNEMFANSSAAEYDNGSLVDVLSNGFKIRATFANMNASGGSFIGYAFAENPFQYARAR